MFITNFSIIMPMDADRLEQFAVTKRAYDAMPQTKEFVIPTRSEFQVARYLDDNKLMKDVRILPYTVEKGFNCSKALNLGVRNAKYENIIITSPEVKPLTDVLGQLAECIGTNVICEVMDEDEDHKVTMSLVNNSFPQSFIKIGVVSRQGTINCFFGLYHSYRDLLPICRSNNLK